MLKTMLIATSLLVTIPALAQRGSPITENAATKIRIQAAMNAVNDVNSAIQSIALAADLKSVVIKIRQGECVTEELHSFKVSGSRRGGPVNVEAPFEDLLSNTCQ